MSTVFVTGGTGLTGANVCEQLIQRGDEVTALVRDPEEAAAVAAIGVELVRGDLTDPGHREDAPVKEDPPDDPYTVTKLEAFLEVQQRADAGDDVLTCHPGAIDGPGLVTDRALHRTSFNRVLLAAMRGKRPTRIARPARVTTRPTPTSATTR